MNYAEYTLTELIYEGAGIALYRGYKTTTGAPVVAKLLTDQYPSPRDIAMLRHEHAILRELNVPGVVKAIDLQRHKNSLFLVLEPTPGESLDKILKAQKLPLITSLRLAKAIADALGAVHKKGVIHKDIKPHNILADLAKSEITLLDFGIATRLRQESVPAAAPDALEGTLAYMSPEQTGRMNRAVDHRTDFYSLGVTMYEMLTGQLPFPMTQPMAIVHSHIARAPARPREHAHEIPSAVDDIVMKLLSKTAEDRYQTAQGLAADLEHCIQMLEEARGIEPFPLGRHDSSGELNISQRLYGREKETSALLAAFDRVAKGAGELLLVSGYSGVGKSVLIHEVHKPIANKGGYFVTGKFDQLSLGTPYFAVMQAFRDLVRQALKEPQDTFARLKEGMIAAVGSIGQLLVDLVPALELIIGPQPAVQALGPTESKNRFILLVQNFLRVFATSERPLVIFLDDLQWADPASLKLLHMLLTDRESSHLLVIGAYRDNEVDAMHLLSIALGDARKAGATIHEIKLLPLAPADVTQLIADSIDSTALRAEPLAAVVYERTRGNPFFMNQFLKALHKEKALVFDAAFGGWTWDQASIRAMKATDNVVEFMLAALRKLAPETQRGLTLAACIGHRFDLDVLSLIDERPRSTTAKGLWEALAEGLIIPLDPEYRFAYDERSAADEPAPASEFRVGYRFLHDRVQQAAYALIQGRKEQQEVHLRIGRLIQPKKGETSGDSDLFDVVNHLNIGAPLIRDPGELLELARLNVAAGKKAKDATAYAAAADYFKAGITALGDGETWDQEHDLTFALHIGLAECASLNGRFEEAEALFDVLLKHATSISERAEIYQLCGVLYNAQDKFQQTIKAVLTGIALFGVEMSESEEYCKAQCDVELAKIKENLAGRSIESLIDAPTLDDPDKRAVVRLMMNLCIAAYEKHHFLGKLALFKQVNFGLQHGHSDLAAYGYAMLAVSLSASYHRMQEGYEFGKLALALNERFNNSNIEAKLNFLFAVHHFTFKPLRDALPYFARAIQAGLESGDFVFASHACGMVVETRFCQGDDLGSVQEEIDKCLALMQRTKNKFNVWRIGITKQQIANLKGQTKSRHTLDDDTFREAELLSTLEAARIAFLAYALYLSKLELAVIYGDDEEAMEHLTQAEKRAWACRGTHIGIERSFYGGLTLLAIYAAAPDDEKPRYLTMLEGYQASLATWAKACPMNYRHKHLLVLAERARVEGDDARAADLYDQAIAAAWENDFLHEEALAKELCARFYLAKGKAIIARAYMTDALYGYHRWGATAKVSLLVARYPELVSRSTTAQHSALLPADLGTLTRQSTGGAIDVLAVIRAAQVVTGEIVLDKLLDRLMRIVIENAGARKGILLLEHDGRLATEASATVEPDVVRVMPSSPTDEGADIPATVVNYVRRTKTPVIFGSGTVDPIFANDPYLSANRPESLLCMALVNQGRLTGVLYLENKITKDAFPPARVELLSLLASQAAVAIENALLYADVQAVTQELRQTNERLTIELTKRVRSEEDRVRSEKERAALQEEIIRAQQERLSELSTPFIPITEGIMVMPLIGTIDESRAERILETALHGAQSSRAKIVILDITGVKTVDSAIAGTLIRTASALRLLGTNVVLSGIRPEVAQMLVMLDVDLGSIVTRGNLQSAIAWALTRSGDPHLHAR
jgi:predicted ATPase/GAF domain-containing protein